MNVCMIKAILEMNAITKDNFFLVEFGCKKRLRKLCPADFTEGSFRSLFCDVYYSTSVRPEISGPIVSE